MAKPSPRYGCSASPGEPCRIDSHGYALVETLVALAIASVTIGAVLAVVSEAGRRLSTAERELGGILAARAIAMVADIGDAPGDQASVPTVSDPSRIDLSVETFLPDAGAETVRWSVRGIRIDVPATNAADAGFVVVEMWPE
jgi:type II secretory pathway pseudopilin PulG